jgi:hypothetical protein
MIPGLSFLATLVAALALGYLLVVTAAAVTGALARGGRRERADSYEAIAVSRFTIPVSVIVPIEDERMPILGTIRSLLALNYPELEVIIVADRVSGPAVEALKKEWALEPKEFFYRRTLPTAPVHRIFGSARDARVMLVEKAAAGRADALNCGVSLARFRYVVSLTPDVIFDADALMRLMSPALRDPAAVLAVTSYVERRSAARQATGDYQRLASIRAWMGSRLAWHRLRCSVPPRDGVIAWRRDAVLEHEGFSVDAADAEVDLLVRLQASGGDRAVGRVVCTPGVFGHADTTSLAAAAQTGERRRRALVEAFGTFSKSPRAGGERLALMCALGVELTTPVAQLVTIGVMFAGAATGWVGWMAPLSTLLLLAFGNAVISAAALLVRGGAPDAPAGRDLVRLLLHAPLEFAVYRPALAWSRRSGRGSIQAP